MENLIILLMFKLPMVYYAVQCKHCGRWTAARTLFIKNYKNVCKFCGKSSRNCKSKGPFKLKETSLIIGKLNSRS